MADDTVQVEINGVSLQARKGAMIIEVADEVGIRIPRFCYHRKLSIAANCRMCLVEVEKAPKPLPACATPVMEGMKVFTRSANALEAQRGTMEFLLINHPLDCPICDQGGECELQDVAMGYGRDLSRYTESKRVVSDKDIGPLIYTEMTRCIHCTRCVRFGQEIAGVMELGAPGRGENMRITTYVSQTVDSELSGNVIDLCPVGALNAKPSAKTARAWELASHASVAPHDCIGSNVWIHTLRSRANRVVPRDNEALNECWLSDRDRFSYEGLTSPGRLTSPKVRRNGVLQDCDWETALNAVADGLRGIIESHGPEQLGALISPTATLEEMYLLQRLVRGLGSGNIDHRLRQAGFDDGPRDPAYPALGMEVAELEGQRAVLLVGSHVRKDQPIAGHRLRRAALQGARMFSVNARDFDFNFPLAGAAVGTPDEQVDALAAILKASAAGGTAVVPPELRALVDGAPEHETFNAVAGALAEENCAAVLLGPAAMAHPRYPLLRALAAAIAGHAGARLGYLTEGANGAGAWLSGAVPHRESGGRSAATTGLNARAMLEAPRKGYVLYGIEPAFDCWDPAAAELALASAEFVVALSAFTGERLEATATVLLPIAPFAETSGTYVNAAGRWQSFSGACTPLGDVRPGWKVLRVLGNLLGLDGFEYLTSAEVRDEVAERAGGASPGNAIADYSGLPMDRSDVALWRVSDVNMYGSDSLTRHARSLQMTRDGQQRAARVCRATAERHGVVGSERVLLRQGNAFATVELVIDDAVAEGCVWIPAGTEVTARLGPMAGALEMAAE